VGSKTKDIGLNRKCMIFEDNWTTFDPENARFGLKPLLLQQEKTLDNVIFDGKMF
jgi:hypothetical protein